MKLANRSFALLLCAAIGLVSCNDDEKPTTPDNKFSVGANTYKIATGAFLKNVEPSTDNEGDEYYRNELLLVGEGINLTTTNGELNGTGAGSFVDLMINNAGPELQAGTYTWQAEENAQPFDLWAGYVTIDWQNGSEVEYELGSGTLTITKTGTTYKATFEGVAHLEDENYDPIPGSEVNVTFQFEGSFLQANRE